jgi:hypothetical protein
MPELLEKLPEKPTNKIEKEELLSFLKREDFQKKKEKSSEKEKPTVKNGSEPSKTTCPKLPRRPLKKTSI